MEYYVKMEIYYMNRIVWFYFPVISTFIITIPGHSHFREEAKPGLYLRVSTVILEPYIIVKYPDKELGDPTRYEGYIVDLMNEISHLLGFQYRIIPVESGSFGYRNTAGNWDGLVGELTNKRADIAAAPLFITSHRSEVVDFTRPFLHVSATLLTKKPLKGVENIIEMPEDLLLNPNIKFGTLNSGIIIREFRFSNNSVNRKIWEHMRKNSPNSFTKSNEEGIKKVRNGNYVYILPNTIGDYITHREPCDLVTHSKFLMNRGYGLAVQKGSALLPRLDKIISLLEMNGFLHRLYQKWWIDTSQCNGVKTSRHTYHLSKAFNLHCNANFMKVVVFLTFLYFKNNYFWV